MVFHLRILIFRKSYNAIAACAHNSYILSVYRIILDGLLLLSGPVRLPAALLMANYCLRQPSPAHRNITILDGGMEGRNAVIALAAPMNLFT